VYDTKTDTIVLVFGNVTDGPLGKGGCDLGSEGLLGPLAIRSSDKGASWSSVINVREQLRKAGVPTMCMDPVNANGIVLQEGGPHAGRLLFTSTHNAYQGDIIVWSDDHGGTFNFSAALHKEGMDEAWSAQLRCAMIPGAGSALIARLGSVFCFLRIC
jgi:hypothetical protein